MNDISIFGFIAGLIVGCGLLVLVAIKYFKDSNQSAFSYFLAILGFLCIGLSIFSTVTLKFGDFELQYETLKNTALAINEENQKMKEAIIAIANNNIEQKKGMKTILDVVQTNQNINPVQVNAINSSLNKIRLIDTNKIKFNPKMDSLIKILSKEKSGMKLNK